MNADQPDGPEPDFPAAHSMDTEWFAVDKDGHVGYFDSGEAGPVPRTIQFQDEFADVFERIFLHAPDVLLRGASRGHALGDAARELGRRGDYYELLGTIGLVSNSPQQVKRLMSNRVLSFLRRLTGRAPKPADDVGPRPLVISRMGHGDYKRIHDAGLCVSCINLLHGGDHFERLGVYHFSAREHYENGPYERKAEPQAPLKETDLPADLLTLVRRTRFADVCFAEGRYLQPLEHLSCAVWRQEEGGEYLASDLVTRRPLPQEPQGRRE